MESVSALSPSLRTQWTCPVAMSSADLAGRGRCRSFTGQMFRRLSKQIHFTFPAGPVFLRFLNVKIQEGDAHNIFCPAYECYQLVPVHVIESVVSREMDQRYLQFDIKVESPIC